ncbi:hypothetical protein CGC20_12225 [Leishmania donovani]|uniref:Uncharacterized protein n=1 Tax=Leishmania donovani TaxID=5661 RepID=A0A504XJ70_LEIDO|nr:hypothetical protein CGC20_12225 [Leishmania donovani]
MGGAADKLVESAAAGAEALNAVPADSVAGPTRQADIPHQPRKARRKEDIIIQFQAGASRHLGFIQRKARAKSVPVKAFGPMCYTMSARHSSLKGHTVTRYGVVPDDLITHVSPAGCLAQPPPPPAPAQSDTL